MSAEIERSHMRISDTERERAIGHLQACVTEGRIDLTEFSERSEAVAAAKTFGDLVPVMSDLPSPDAVTPSDDALELAPRNSAMKRRGQWLVPKRITLRPKNSSLKLDFNEAAMGHREIDIEVDGKNSSITLVLPRGSFAYDNVNMRTSSLTNRVPFTGEHSGVRFNIQGEIKGSSMTIRHRRKFLWWTY